MAIKLVVFDMAGTTVDDKDYVSEALGKGFQKAGYEITVADANSVMGIPKPVAIRTLLNEKFDLHFSLYCSHQLWRKKNITGKHRSKTSLPR